MGFSLESTYTGQDVVYQGKWVSLFLSMCFRYKAIVKYKTAFYSFYLPVAAAMYIVSGFINIVFSGCGGINGQGWSKLGFTELVQLSCTISHVIIFLIFLNIYICKCIYLFGSLQAGIVSEEEHNNAKHILLEMGEFFQIQVFPFACHL